MEDTGYKTFEGQSWLDVSVALYGNVEQAFDLALKNGGSITENIKTGNLAKYDDAPQNILVMRSLENNKSIPATGVSHTGNLTRPQPEGIDYWAIQMDFRIS